MSLYAVTDFFIEGLSKGYIATRASAISFSFFLAIFPFLIFLFTIIPFIPERRPNGYGYAFRFQPPVVLASDDLIEATQQVNDLLEAQVRTQPEQYLWAHKRFKPPSSEHTDPYQ